MLVIEKMRQKENFTALERQISDYILEHRDEMFEMSLAELAGRLYVSKATVIRYFKKLGFSSYRELCVELAKEQNYYHASLQKESTDQSEGAETIEETALRLQKSAAAAMSLTAQYLDYKIVKEMADIITRSSRILVCGFNAGGMNTADNMFVRLSRMGKDTTVIDQRSLYLNTYRNYGKDTAAVIAVYNDADGRVAKVAKGFADKGIPVLLLCGPFTGEIDRYAAKILRTHYNEDTDARSVPKRMALEFLGDILYYAVVNAAPAAANR